MTKERSSDQESEASPGSVGRADSEPPRAGLSGLRARLLEREHTRRVEADLRRQQELLQSIIDQSVALTFAKAPDGRYLVVNRRFESFFGISRAHIRGKSDHEVFSRELAEQLAEHDRAAIAAGGPLEVEEVLPGEGGLHTFLVLRFPLHDASGVLTAVCGMATDITERKRAERERAELQQAIISAQQASLKELSTPLIPLAEGVLVMPLVGTIDDVRASQIMETLLHGITAQAARTAILDVTGVKVVDERVANGLVRAAQAAKLLGAEVILTGIGPAMAVSLIDLGADLGSVATLGTLRAGIARALSRSASSDATR